MSQVHTALAQGVQVMKKLSYRSLAVAAILIASTQFAHAVVVQWDPDSGNAREWNTSLNNWTAYPATTQTTYSNDNMQVRFRNGNSHNTGTPARTGTVFIGLAASPVDVMPGGEILFTNGGGIYDFSGGNILDNGGNPTSMRIVWDLQANFNYTNASLGFTGGTGLGTGSATNAGIIRYVLSSAAGSYNFGTGDITFGNRGGTFEFNPDAAATLTNDIVFDNTAATHTSSIRGNANATYSGQVTVNAGGNFTRGSGNFVSSNATGILLNGDEDLNFSFNGSTTQFETNIDGQGIYDVRLVGNTGGNPDWTNKLTEGSTPWNIVNLTKTGINRTRLEVDETTFFSSIESNGGHFLIEGGMIQFQDTTPTINFDLIIDPNAATQKVGYEDYAGLHLVDTLTVASGGLVGGSLLAERSTAGTTITWNDDLIVNIDGGEISPGQSVDILELRGDLNFTGSGGTMTIEVTGGGAVAGTDYDQIDVLNNASGFGLADLVVEIDPSLTFADLDGDTLTILTSANDLSGLSFDTVTFSGLGVTADAIFGNGFIQLTNFESSIPEPSSLMLMVIGGMAMAARRRRRRR